MSWTEKKSNNLYSVFCINSVLRAAGVQRTPTQRESSCKKLDGRTTTKSEISGQPAYMLER